MSGEHLYDGQPDARQMADVDAPVSRFRPRYRALTPEEKALHDEIKAQAEVLERLFGQVPKATPDQARYHAMAMTDLERSIMWIVKGLTS